MRMNGIKDTTDFGKVLSLDYSGNVLVSGWSRYYLTTGWDFVCVKYNQPNAIKKIAGKIPVEFTLGQNCPNPFNPFTKITFDIPNLDFVSITVFDILGREVLVLVNEQLQPGTYEVEWDGSNYSTGVYYYLLQTGNKVSTKK
jgi:hypothetical protein